MSPINTFQGSACCRLQC